VSQPKPMTKWIAPPPAPPQDMRPSNPVAKPAAPPNREVREGDFLRCPCGRPRWQHANAALGHDYPLSWAGRLLIAFARRWL
jgi:hypothetical protein